MGLERPCLLETWFFQQMSDFRKVFLCDSIIQMALGISKSGKAPCSVPYRHRTYIFSFFFFFLFAQKPIHLAQGYSTRHFCQLTLLHIVQSLHRQSPSSIDVPRRVTSWWHHHGSRDIITKLHIWKAYIYRMVSSIGLELGTWLDWGVL